MTLTKGTSGINSYSVTTTKPQHTMKIPTMNTNALKNAGIDTVSTIAALAALDLLNSDKMPEAIVAAILSVSFSVVKYHYFQSAKEVK